MLTTLSVKELPHLIPSLLSSILRRITQYLRRGLRMATFRKSGSGWRAEVFKRGVRKSATFQRKAEAQAWAAQVESDISAQRAGTIPNKTLADLLDKYQEEVAVNKRGYDWEVKRIRVLKGYRISQVRLSDLDATHVAKWRDERSQAVSGSSVNRDWNLLSYACEVARKEWRWIHENPFKGQVTRPKSNPPRQKTYSSDEVEKITLALGSTGISGRVSDAFMFALETAMRAGEIVGIRKEDIHPTHVHLPKTKNGSARDVPLSKKAHEILAKYPDGFGLTSRQLDVLFRRGKKLAGVDGQFRDTRATALTRLAKIIPNPMTLARISGHKDLKILQNVYYRPSVEDLVSLLDGGELPA